MSDEDQHELEKIPGIGPKRGKALRVAGYKTLADLENASEEDLRAVKLIDDILARDIKATVSPSEDTPRISKQMNHIIPENWKVTKSQADHIKNLTEEVSIDIEGATAADIRDRLEWHIDPELLAFERICGRVRKPDPDTGELHPVPNATVHVEDTDCSFLSYFPDGLGLGWFFPYNCSSEEIASTTTDECGRFCVFVPRWDIDRVLRFRRDRVCLPEIHTPNLGDILEDPHVFPKPVIPPRPQPDPLPSRLRDPGVLERTSELVGETTLRMLSSRMDTPTFGDSSGDLRELLEMPAFPRPVDPPLPEGFGLEDPENIEDLPIDPDVLEAVDPDRRVGPFLECQEVIIPEWRTFIDVPDITFRVTQDIDRDGTEETIYDEGYFDVRWDADDIPEVDLIASDDAISVPTCEGLTPENVECEEPSIESIGLMPARSPYHDSATGYSPRLNKPKPITGPRPDGTAPYAGTLQLHGCHRFEEADYYRLLYSFEGNSETPFTGHEWHAPAIGRDPVHVHPVDGDGWYPILDIPYLETYYGESLGDNPLIFPFWILNWNTRHYQNGKYTVRLELGRDDGDGGKTALGTGSQAMAFEVDNRAPHLNIDKLVWGDISTSPDSWSNDITDSCPRIERPAGTDIGIKVKFRAWGEHFRSVRVSAHGCNQDPIVDEPEHVPGQENVYEYWHQSVPDRNHTQTVVFEVPASYDQGAYRISLDGFSRAFNPAGSGTGPGSNWQGDPNYIESDFNRLIAITNR